MSLHKVLPAELHLLGKITYWQISSDLKEDINTARSQLNVSSVKNNTSHRLFYSNLNHIYAWISHSASMNLVQLGPMHVYAFQMGCDIAADRCQERSNKVFAK